MKVLLGLIIIFSAGVSQADIYNHGNHNDPYNQFFNGTETFNCGSLSVYDCVDLGTIQSMTEDRCETKVVNTDSGGLVVYGQSYYHTVQSFAIIVQSVNGPAPYSMQVSFKCGGYQHPGIPVEFEPG